MINALKAYLIIEVPVINRMSDTNIPVYMNEIRNYVNNELFADKNDDSLIVLVFASDRLNVQLLNSPYDAWERFEDTLSERFSNIEEFISNICNV